MLGIVVWITIAIAGAAFLSAYRRFRDPFHPLIFTMPMFVFIYGYMPLSQLWSGQLFDWVTPEQALFTQGVAMAMLLAFVFGCEKGIRAHVPEASPATYDLGSMQKGAYVLGVIGFAAWVYMLRQSGGFAGAYGRGDGMLWNDIGYIRDSSYLLLVAILILLSPQAFSPRKVAWWLAIAVFTVPWATQAALGARRGPTFVLFVSIGVSWYMARNSRPSLGLTIGAGAFVGLLMLFLVANRGSIYFGSDQELSADKVGEVTKAGAENEYIFGTGTIAASRETNHYFWGRRLLAQFLVRPVPRQLWPNKYADFGIPELEQNAGMGADVESVMGWKAVPGASAAMVADLWKEFSWGAIPFAALWGWAYGYCWKRASVSGAGWITQYVIFLLLSVYLITQGLEAVTFRLLILSFFSRLIWRRATVMPVAEQAVNPAYAS